MPNFHYCEIVNENAIKCALTSYSWVKEFLSSVKRYTSRKRLGTAALEVKNLIV